MTTREVKVTDSEFCFTDNKPTGPWLRYIDSRTVRSGFSLQLSYVIYINLGTMVVHAFLK